MPPLVRVAKKLKQPRPNSQEGEIHLLNSTYPKSRFPFAYAWWSAYGFERYVQGDPPEAADMTLVDRAPLSLAL